MEAAIGLPTLGTIAKMRTSKDRSEIYQLATLLHHLGPVAEAYRSLRTSVEFAAVDAPVDTLLVTSAIPDEGKTLTASNLAVVFAQAGRRTILLDADFRKPGVHKVFDLPNSYGLSNLLRSEAGTSTTSPRPRNRRTCGSSRPDRSHPTRRNSWHRSG